MLQSCNDAHVSIKQRIGCSSDDTILTGGAGSKFPVSSLTYYVSELTVNLLPAHSNKTWSLPEGRDDKSTRDSLGSLFHKEVCGDDLRVALQSSSILQWVNQKLLPPQRHFTASAGSELTTLYSAVISNWWWSGQQFKSFILSIKL